MPDRTSSASALISGSRSAHQTVCSTMKFRVSSSTVVVSSSASGGTVASAAARADPGSSRTVSRTRSAQSGGRSGWPNATSSRARRPRPRPLGAVAQLGAQAVTVKLLSLDTRVPSWLNRPSPPCFSDRRRPCTTTVGRRGRTSGCDRARPGPGRRPLHGGCAGRRRWPGTRRRAAGRPAGPGRRGGRSRSAGRSGMPRAGGSSDRTSSSGTPWAAARKPTMRAPSASDSVAPKATRVSAGSGGPPWSTPSRPASASGQPRSGQPRPTTAPWAMRPRGHQEPSVTSGGRPATVASSASAPGAGAAAPGTAGNAVASTSCSSSPPGSDHPSSARRP